MQEESKNLEISWQGKEEAITQATSESNFLLQQVHGKSRPGHTFSHQFIIGDNLEAMKCLLPQYKEKIDQIYIDPPYNTGNQFVYNDRYGSTADWLSMMYPRLFIARNLLAQEGIIFVSIDDHELASLKLIMDEIFGPDNYIEIFSWVKSATPANLSKKSKKVVEYVLCYQKEKSSKKFKGIKKSSHSSNGLLNQSNPYRVLEFPEYTVSTKLSDGLIPSGTYGTAKYHIELLDDVEVKDGIFINSFRLKGKFKWSQKKIHEEIKKGTKIAIPTIKFSPSYDKSYYEPEVPPNLIDHKVGVSTNEVASRNLYDLMGSKLFEYPKPTSLIKYLLGFIGSTNDIIMDFYAGSASTMQAVMEMNIDDKGNRECICIQNEDLVSKNSNAGTQGFKTISEIGIERINRFIAKQHPLGHQPLQGLKIYKLIENQSSI